MTSMEAVTQSITYTPSGVLVVLKHQLQEYAGFASTAKDATEQAQSLVQRLALSSASNAMRKREKFLRDLNVQPDSLTIQQEPVHCTNLTDQLNRPQEEPTNESDNRILRPEFRN